MPVTIAEKGNRFVVRTPGGVKSKGSTKKNAKAQKRLLLAVEHGWRPTSDGKMKK